jgi:phosphoglycolate phosphatase (TIGR01487 family)
VLKAVLTDVDGTLTDRFRRLSTDAVTIIRELIDQDIPVVLASGNSSCFMDALCRVIGTDGTFIAENGGVYRVGYEGDLHVRGDQEECWEAFSLLRAHFTPQGIVLPLFSPTYRFADVAFARTVPSATVREILKDSMVQVIDTGYAIHLQSAGTNKGIALSNLSKDLGMQPYEFLAIGDSLNDVEMLQRAGVGVAVANAHEKAKAHAQYVTEKEYGSGFVEAIRKYSSYFLER